MSCFDAHLRLEIPMGECPRLRWVHLQHCQVSCNCPLERLDGSEKGAPCLEELLASNQRVSGFSEKGADLFGGPGNFRGSFQGSLWNFRGTSGLPWNPQWKKFSGSHRRSGAKFWEAQGAFRRSGEVWLSPSDRPKLSRACLRGELWVPHPPFHEHGTTSPPNGVLQAWWCRERELSLWQSVCPEPPSCSAVALYALSSNKPLAVSFCGLQAQHHAGRTHSMPDSSCGPRISQMGRALCFPIQGPATSSAQALLTPASHPGPSNLKCASTSHTSLLHMADLLKLSAASEQGSLSYMWDQC